VQVPSLMDPVDGAAHKKIDAVCYYDVRLNLIQLFKTTGHRDAHRRGPIGVGACVAATEYFASNR